MHPCNTATADYLLAAKRAEIASLNQLAANCELVTRVNDLIHELQRERGLSNVYLQSAGQRFGEQRARQIGNGRRAEARLRDYLGRLDTETGPLSGNARLFNNIAYVLHGLDELPQLRRKVDRRSLDAADSTAALGRLIHGLLAVVFEAADISGDPEITRALVALFNFMQGKEYAGQERAWGAIGFAAGRFEAAQLERLAHLQESQQRCFELFADCAEPGHAARWRQIERDEAAHELERLRNVVGRLDAGTGLPPAISEVWYDLTTRRIDAMQTLERQLSSALSQLSRHRVRQACQDLQQQRDRLQLLRSLREPLTPPLTRTLDGGEPEHELVRTLYEMIQTQSERLRCLGDELTEAREALRDRKRIERAKGLLMQRHGLGEEQAYRRLQQTAMRLNQRLIDVARQVIDDGDRGDEPLQGRHMPQRTNGAHGSARSKSGKTPSLKSQPSD